MDPHPARVIVETRAWFNENLESRNVYVRGIIVLIVTLVTRISLAGRKLR